MPNFLVRWAILAASLWVAVQLVSGLKVEGGVVSYVLIAAVFGLVNAIAGTVFKLFTFPLIILSLGLFTFVINAVMLLITAGLVDSFAVDGFLPALLGAVVISIASLGLNLTVGQVLRK